VRLRLDPSTRLLAGGAIVLGGQPARLLRLTPAGADLVVAWRDGAAVSPAPAAQRLAARLVATGLAHPVPVPGRWTVDDVAVVIPARDRADLLAACLARVGPAREIVVVDDGSLDPGAVAAVAHEGGARVVRRPDGEGPAGARNAGLAATAAPLVAFLDSDTTPGDGWLAPLLAHFSDPAVAAVAPRVAAPEAPATPARRSALAAYEAVRSPLDLGPVPGVVGPRRRIGFVPAAALVVRRAAMPPAGFDAAMRVGEDVDLAWRLTAAGWTVRYEPAARVEHPTRTGPRAWLGQRVAYGASAGPIARRHPGSLRHLVLPRSAIAPWGLALAGHPGAALLAGAGATALVSRRLPAVPGTRRELVAVAAGAQLRAGRQLLDAAWRAYPPVVLAAAVGSRRMRRLGVAGLAVSIAADWAQRRPRLDPVRYGALRTADDLAYATGVWLGCLRSRTAGPLIPKVVA
jgi:mycofactocin system glycosyltransferase